MISIERLLAVKTIVSHRYPEGACPDGLAASMILRDALPEAEVRLISYNTKEHAEIKAEPGMLFCDITPPRARAAEFVEMKTIVLDHHARDLVEPYGPLGVFADLETEPGVSGAVLAYREVWEPLMFEVQPSRYADDIDYVRHFATLAGVRDTWQKDSSLWHAACAQAAALTFYPIGDWLLEKGPVPLDRALRGPLDPDRLRERMNVGALVIARKEREDEAILEGAERFTSGCGTRVVVVAKDSPSDIAERVCESKGEQKCERNTRGADLVVGFSYRVQDGARTMKVSLRSRGGVDCRRFARLFGGGGHVGSAGFVLDLTKTTHVTLSDGSIGSAVPELQSRGSVSQFPRYFEPYEVVRELVQVAEFYMGSKPGGAVAPGGCASHDKG